MKRRSFLKAVGGTVAAGAAASQGHGEAVTQEVVRGFPRRRLGRTGEMITMVGFPGLALRQYPQEEGTAKLHETFEQGVPCAGHDLTQILTRLKACPPARGLREPKQEPNGR